MKPLQSGDKFRIYQKAIEGANINKEEMFSLKQQARIFPLMPTIVGKRRTLIPQSTRVVVLDHSTPTADITYVLVEAQAYFPKLFNLESKIEQVRWEAVSPESEPEGKKCYGRFFIPEGLLYFLLQKQGRYKMERKVREITDFELGAGSRHERWIYLLPQKKVVFRDTLYSAIDSFTRHPRIYCDY